MNQEIQLYLTEYGYLDLEDGFPIPLVFQISDVSDITKRKGNFSKTIVLPGTANNNLIFTQAYEITKTGGFNATTKHPCVLYVDKNPIINGYLLLNKIEKLRIGEGFQVQYSVNIYDELNNFFTELQNKSLQELDFSSGFTFTSYKNSTKLVKAYDKGNHIFNEANALNAYTTNIYRYPIVNYNYNDILYRNPNKSFPYNSISLGYLYPAVSFKAIVDKIFYDIGYTYESNFFNDYTGTTNAASSEVISGLFHRIFNIYNGEEKITEKIYCNLTLSNWTRPTSNKYWFYLPFGNSRNNISLINPETITSVSTSYHTKAGEVCDIIFKNVNGSQREPLIEITEDGDYYLDFYIDVETDEGGTHKGTGSGWLPNCTGCTTSYDIRCENDTKRRTQVGGQVIMNAFYGGFGFYGDYEDASLNVHITSTEMGHPYNIHPTGDTSYTYSTGFTFSAKKGDVVYVQINNGMIDNSGTVNYTSNYKINEFKLKLSEKITDNNYVNKYGKEISLSDYLPDMTQVDFLKNIINMFNLYITYDKENPKLLHIEPYDYYFSQGTKVDWSNKVDYSEKLSISTLTDKLKNKYIYTYSDGEDYYSKLFKSIYGYNYGAKVENLNNQYLNDDQNNDNKYQSYQYYNVVPESVYNSILTHSYSGNTSLTIPMIETDNLSTAFSTKAGVSPIMGIINYNSYTYKVGGNNQYGKYLNLLRPSTYDNYEMYYFQEASMYSPKTKTYTLLFDDTNYTNDSTDGYSLLYSSDYKTILLSGVTEYLYSTLDYIYPVYHQNQLENIIDNDAREVELMVNLTINDIIALDFRNTIFIDGQNYIVQKINFDPTSNNSSKVLFLKII